MQPHSRNAVSSASSVYSAASGPRPYAPSMATTQSAYAKPPPPGPPPPHSLNHSRRLSKSSESVPCPPAFHAPPDPGVGAPPGFEPQASEGSQPRWAGECLRGPPGANLFVFHLPNAWTADDLREAFTPCGAVLSAYVFLDFATGSSRGFGFVAYEEPISAARALQVMGGHRVAGKRLRVTVKKGEEAALVQAMAALAATGWKHADHPSPEVSPSHDPRIPRPHTPPGRPLDLGTYAKQHGIAAPSTPPRRMQVAAAHPPLRGDEDDWQDVLPPDHDAKPVPPPYDFNAF